MQERSLQEIVIEILYWVHFKPSLLLHFLNTKRKDWFDGIGEKGNDKLMRKRKERKGKDSCFNDNCLNGYEQEGKEMKQLSFGKEINK